MRVAYRGVVLLAVAALAASDVAFATFGGICGRRDCTIGSGGGAPDVDWDGSLDYEEQEVVQPDPVIERYNALINRASAARQRGDLREALRFAREALSLHENDETRRWIRAIELDIEFADAMVLYRQGKIDDALPDFRRIAADPVTSSEFKTWFAKMEREHLAEIARQRAEVDRRQRDRSKANDLNDDAADLLAANDPEAAIAKLNQALALRPNDPLYESNYWLARAGLALKRGSLTETIVALETAANLNPDNAKVKAALDQARAKRDAQGGAAMLREAEASIERLTRAPSPTSQTLDTRVAASTILPKQAEEIERSPGAPEARLGFEAIARGDWEAAVKRYREAWRKDIRNTALYGMVDLAEYTLAGRRIRVHVGGALGDAAEQAGKGDLSAARASLDHAMLDPALRDRAVAMRKVLDDREAEQLAKETFGEAQKMVRDALRLCADQSASTALSLAAQGRLAEAHKAMLEAAALQPEDKRYSEAAEALRPLVPRTRPMEPDTSLGFIRN